MIHVDSISSNVLHKIAARVGERFNVFGAVAPDRVDPYGQQPPRKLELVELGLADLGAFITSRSLASKALG